jgi:hypothetical protein
MKRLALITLASTLAGIVACATTGQFQTTHQIDPPGPLPKIEISFSGKIGDDGAAEGTQTIAPAPALAGLCIRTDYFDQDGALMSSQTFPLDGSEPISGGLPAGSVFHRSTIGPCEKPEGDENSPSAPGGLHTLPLAARGSAALHEWTAFGGRIVLNTGESNVDYVVQVLAPDYATAQARIDWVVDSGIGAIAPAWVQRAFVSELSPHASGAGLSLRVATLGSALEHFALVLNGKVIADSAVGLNVQQTTLNGWVGVATLIGTADVAAGSVPGATYQNEAYLLFDTDAEPEPWLTHGLFAHFAE